MSHGSHCVGLPGLSRPNIQGTGPTARRSRSEQKEQLPALHHKHALHHMLDR